MMMHVATFPAFSPRTGRRLAILALVLYVSFLVAAAPASVLAWALAQSTNGAVGLERVEGSLWSGRAAALVIVDGSGTTMRLERLRWDSLLARLAASELALRIDIDDAKLQCSTVIALRSNTVRASEATIRFPASTLGTYLPHISGAGLSGNLTLRSRELVLGNTGFRGAATIEWHHAASRLPSAQPVEVYHALVTGNAQRADVQVETLAGPLQLNGRGVWSRKEGVSFQGTTRAPAEYRGPLGNLLNLFGHRQDGTTHHFRAGPL